MYVHDALREDWTRASGYAKYVGSFPALFPLAVSTPSRAITFPPYFEPTMDKFGDAVKMEVSHDFSLPLIEA